ncbi:MAG: right-handed parallel beta-helix repeat-containing protein, partial [Nanoarchaeota archaeon]
PGISAFAVGIRASRNNNIVIKNLVVSSFHLGVYLDSDSNNNILTNITANNNLIGIYIDPKSSNNIVSSITANNNNDSGIYLWGNSNNALSNITANRNNIGIYLWTSSNNTLTNILTNNNKYGVYLYSNSNNNILTNITANNNNMHGIALFTNCSNNILSSIIANNNSNGLYLVYLYSNSNNTLTNIVTNNNRGYGIWLWTSSNNTLTNIVTNNNGYSGIYLSTSGSGDVRSTFNTFSNITANNNNNSGILLGANSENTFSDIIANNNNQSGIWLSSSFDNSFSDIIANNNRYAVYTSSSSNNIFSSISVDNNTNAGIMLYGGSNNIIKDGNIYSGGLNDVNVSFSENNTFLNVTYNIAKEYVNTYSTLIRKWYFDVSVQDRSSNLIENAIVNVNDSNGNIIFQENTSSLGITSLYTLTQYSSNGRVRANYTYFATATKNNTSNFTAFNIMGNTRAVIILQACSPYLINSTWSEWINISCLKVDLLNQSRSRVQYDSNNCGLIINQTFVEYQTNQICDYCQPHPVNTTFSEWKNQTSCLFGDYYIQNKSIIEYDSNYSSCYALTNLPTDLWNNGLNKTYWNFQNQTCDFCKPNISTFLTNWQNISCLLGDKMNQSRINTSYDVKQCINSSTGNLEYQNSTLNEYRQLNNSCDFCTPNLTNTTWNNWTNVGICTIKDIQNQSRFRVQYDNKSCSDHSILNQTILEYQGVSCDYCKPNPINTTVTESDWKNQTSCLLGDYYIQNRSIIEYDANYSSCYDVTHLQNDSWNNGENKTYWEFRNQSCEVACILNLTNTTWSDWVNISCLSNNKMNQSRFLTQYDSSSCPNSQNKTVYGYQAIEDCNIINPPNSSSLSLTSPINKIYSERSIPFDVSSTSKFVKLVYSDNNGRESTLCTNCFGYARSKSLSDGNHTILFRGVSLNGKNVTNQTSFFIDSKDPQISTIKPASRKYSNGSDFYIKYTEDNLENVTLFYGNDKIEKNSCEDGRNKNCTFAIDLSKYDNQSLVYSFRLVDIAGNIDQSRNTTIKIDATAPEIKDFKAPISGKYVSFNMTILNEDKNSFNKVEYQDNSGSRWNSLCTSLKNNNCFKKVYFRTGNHNLVVRATDDAGNSDTEIININIV